MTVDPSTVAKEKCQPGSSNNGAIIFIDELDAVGTKRFDSELSGDREVQRTMLELLNQLDGFSSDAKIKVRIACVEPRQSDHDCVPTDRSCVRVSEHACWHVMVLTCVVAAGEGVNCLGVVGACG